MAAIKRCQANQRRQPEIYQVVHHAANPLSSISLIKVELKNFIISILDDPIASRVLAEAGFRSTDIKLAIIRPPASPLPYPARFFGGDGGGAGGRSPPLFLCNLTDSGFSVGRNIPFYLPGVGGVSGGDSDGDEYCRRIGEILVKSSGRNPLLVGVCARDALGRFKDSVQKRDGESVLPSEIVGLDWICVEKEIREFVLDGGSKDVLDSKVKKLCSTLEKHTGPGVVVNFGELNMLVKDGGSEDAVKCLVSKLSRLVELYKNKMWLIGATTSYDWYRKFLTRFSTLERDWDLQPLPITSSNSLVGGLYSKSKSSLMGSFVPFGGFFSTTSEFRSPLDIQSQTYTRCSMCNEKYDLELCSLMRKESSVSVAGQCSTSLPSWLQMANSDKIKPGNATGETKDDKAEPNAKILELQRKWDGICQRLHQVPKIPKPDVFMATPAIPCSMDSQFIAGKKGSEDSYSNDRLSSSLGSIVLPKVQKNTSQGQILKPEVVSLQDNFHSQPQLASEVSPSSVSSVITDIGLGTFQPACQELNKPDSHENRGQLQHFSCSVSSEKPVNDKASGRVLPSSFPAGPDLCHQLRDRLNQGDYKLILKELTEKVAWQVEACHHVGQIVSRCRGENGYYQHSNVRRDTWITFIGPDKVGKKRMAETLADLMFGSRESLIAVDLSAQERISKPHFMFGAQLPDDPGVKSGRKTVVDHIAEELSKKPFSVVLLENVDKADDLLAQRSLCHAIQTGKFPDSRGREISIINAIVLMTCSLTKEDHAHSSANGFIKLSEERILEAHSWQMQIVIERAEGEAAARSSNKTSVALAMGKSDVDKASISKRKQDDTDLASISKRKQDDTDLPFRHKKPKGFFDLNLPLEEDSEEVTEMENRDDSDTISDNSRAWLEDFLEQVDNKVKFKPFNFDSLAEKLLNKMSLSLQNKLGVGTRLEVDEEVMVQILAAAWCSDGKGAVDDWIKEVLSGSFLEIRRRFSLDQPFLLKLVSLPGTPVDKEAPGIRLPMIINIE